MGNLIAAPMNHDTEKCNIDAPIPMEGANLALYLLEMVICGAVLVSCGVFSTVLARTSTFDRTMKALFWNMLFSSFGITSTRLFFLILQTISNGTLYNATLIAKLSIFHDICINVDVLLQLAITLECLFATPTHTERESSSLLGLLLLGVQSLWPWLLTCALYALEQHGFIETVPEFMCLAAINLSSWLIFLRLYFVNRRKYKTMSVGHLDKKYQVTVKIRNLRTLLFLSAITTGRNFFLMGLLIAIIQVMVPQCMVTLKHFADHCYDTTCALYGLVLIVPLLLTHQEFRKHFKGLMCRSATSSKPGTIIVVSTVAKAPRNALGEALIVPHNAQNYQLQLAQCWERGPQPASSRESGANAQKQSLLTRHVSIALRRNDKYGQRSEPGVDRHRNVNLNNSFGTATMPNANANRRPPTRNMSTTSF